MMDDEWDSYLSTGSALLLTSQITFLQFRVPALEQICWRPVKITISPHQLLAVGFFIIYFTKLQREASYHRNKEMKTCFPRRFSALRVPYSRVKHEWQSLCFDPWEHYIERELGQFKIWDKGSKRPQGSCLSRQSRAGTGTSVPALQGCSSCSVSTGSLHTSPKKGAPQISSPWAGMTSARNTTQHSDHYLIALSASTSTEWKQINHSLCWLMPSDKQWPVTLMGQSSQLKLLQTTKVTSWVLFFFIQWQANIWKL